ncbi:MAG: 16S rRNA (cytosine(967)-C(5))-methyltransferase RsmB [Pseudomonadota bacterium]
MSEPGTPKKPTRRRRKAKAHASPTGGTALGSPARVRLQAARAVVGVVRDGRSLTRLLPKHASPIEAPRDRSFYRTLVFGTIRYWERYRFLLTKLLGKPLREDAHLLEALLCVGLCQLEHLAVPAHAAVGETVAAARAALGKGPAGLANAVLRRYDRERASLDAAVADEPTAHHALPSWWLARWREDWPEDWQALALAARTQAPMWLRVNAQRLSREDWLAQAGLEARVHPTLPQALCLESAVDVQALPGFEAGEVSVQDAAAQYAAHALQAPPGARVLDACAAPGGKSAHLMEIVPGIELLSIDVSARRLEQVEETLVRLGLEQASASRRLAADAGDPQTWWDGRLFDRILLDAPCSASGVIRRHPDIKLLRRHDDLGPLAQTQALLLRKLWPLLAPGGRLLYVTCSVLKCENDAVVSDFLSEMSDVEVEDLTLHGARKTAYGCQIMSGEDDMDGFYYASLVKP